MFDQISLIVLLDTNRKMLSEGLVGLLETLDGWALCPWSLPPRQKREGFAGKAHSDEVVVVVHIHISHFLFM